MLKIRQTILLLTIVCLAVILATQLAACAPTATTVDNLPIGSIAVMKNGSDFTVIQVSAIGSTELTATFVKNGGTAEEHTYQATALGSLLAAAGVTDLGIGTKIVITARDGYAATFTAEEVQAADNIYLASLIDSQPIKGSDGLSAAMVIAKDDDFSNRWVSDIMQIEIISG